MMLLLVSAIISSSALKLLESETPTTPYKPASDKTTSQSACKKVETWGAAKWDKKLDSSPGAVAVELSPGTKCDIAIKAGTPVALKILSKTTTTVAEKVKATRAFGNILDRCCQSTYDIMTPDTAKNLTGMKNVGFGKGRLPGVPDTCKGWKLLWVASYADSLPTMTTVPEITFWSTLPTPAAKIINVGVTSYDVGEAKSANTLIHMKVAFADPPTLTCSGTLCDTYTAKCVTQATKANDNACLEAARNQCMSGSWTAPSSGSQMMDLNPIVCGGFCSPSNSGTATFYKVSQCYLEMGGGSAGDRCYSTKSPTPNPGQMPAAFNDPKVVNMAGEQFEILASGTFSMLNIAQDSRENLKILATIDRAGSRCGATYIQNISLSGGWVSQLGVSGVSVRATAAVPKKSALQISIDQEQTWLQYSNWKNIPNFTLDKQQDFKLKLNSVTIEVSVDSHRVVEGSRKTRRFANFLNLNIKGIHDLPKSYAISGLLGTDDHSDVMVVPEDCKGESFSLLSRASLNTELSGDDDESEGEGQTCALEDCGAASPEN